jgi:2',3'-cyclic-nucleotide 2'-phosphodiesterase (5'-nucleotidase family)
MLYAELFMGALNQMGYDALNLGEAELLARPGLVERMNELADFPVISSNLSCVDPRWKAYLIKETNGVRIAIMGVLSSRFRLKDPTVTVELPVDSLKRLMADLSGKADVFVLLSHMGWEESRALLREIEGIDIAIISHAQGPALVETVGKTLAMSAGVKGENVGHIKVAWGTEEKEIVRMSYEMHRLGDDIENDDGIRELVRAFNTKVNKWQEEEYRRMKQQQSEMEATVERAMKMTPEEFLKYNREVVHGRGIPPR